MKVFCLGGVGRICREAALDMLQHSQRVTRLTIGDRDEKAATEVATWLDDQRADHLGGGRVRHRGLRGCTLGL